MKKIGKLVFGSALLGAAAYGIHSLVNQLEQGEDLYESEYVDEAEDNVDADVSDAAAPADEKAEAFKAAAGRAYTTIQHGSRQAMDKVKEAVGPKGEEVINEVGSAAKEMGKTVTDSASRIREILQKKDEPAEDIVLTPAAEEDQAEEAVEVEIAPAAEEDQDLAEEAAKTMEKAADSYVTLKDAATEVKAAVTEQAETLESAADAGKVEQFFDDEEA